MKISIFHGSIIKIEESNKNLHERFSFDIHFMIHTKNLIYYLKF